MFKRWAVMGAIVALAGSSLAACSSDEGKKTVSDSVGTGPSVEWAQKVCAAVTSGSLRLQMPDTDPKNAKKSKQAIVVFLTDLSTQLGTLDSNLETIGKPPVATGEKSYTDAMANLKGSKEAVDKGLKTLKASKVSTIPQLKTALADVAVTIDKFSSYRGPAGDMVTNPDLKAVFAKTPACASVVAGK
ncbi:hypothetical protein GCM10027589_07500 [Actinocorallia lasiicapitis]